MEQQGVVSTLGPVHKDVVQVRKEYFQDIKEESLLAIKQRWKALVTKISRPCLDRMSLQVPIIWYAPEGYYFDYDYQSFMGSVLLQCFNKIMVLGCIKKKFILHTL